MESVDKFCRERSKCVQKIQCNFFGDSLSKYRKMPTGQEKKRTLSKLRSLVCNKAENGVCCDEPTLLATLQVELLFNILVVVILRPGNRRSRRAITLCCLLVPGKIPSTALLGRKKKRNGPRGSGIVTQSKRSPAESH